MNNVTPQTLLISAIMAGGAGQIFTALVYPYVRHHVFNCYEDVKQLRPLNQQIAKTYGYYIQGLNFSFGLIAIIMAPALITGEPLALALTGLIAAYWVGKLVVQVLHYPMYEIPQTWFNKIGEVLMNTLFVYFALLYVFLVAWNLVQAG